MEEMCPIAVQLKNHNKRCPRIFYSDCKLKKKVANCMLKKGGRKNEQ